MVAWVRFGKLRELSACRPIKITRIDNYTANAVAMRESATLDEGIEAIAEAISYGIAKGFADPQMATAFASGGIVPPTGNILAGQVLHTAIAGITTEP